LWATDAHDYFIDQLFGHLPPAIRDIIKSGSAYADTFRFQGDDHSFMHAMSSNTLTKAQANQKMCDYVNDYMGRARDAKAKNQAHYWFYLGMALHAVMDSTSPAHEGFQKWNGIRADGARHGPWRSSLENLSVAKQPGHTQRTVEAMRNAMKGNW
jgi:hypothetical protein